MRSIAMVESARLCEVFDLMRIYEAYVYESGSPVIWSSLYIGSIASFQQNKTMQTWENAGNLMMLRSIMNHTVVIVVLTIVILWLNQDRLTRNRRRRRFSYLDQIPGQVNNLRDLVDVNDEDCKKMLRMD
ncbi:hypothetical protein ACS0TY_021938 [Phlomoides rotata]